MKEIQDLIEISKYAGQRIDLVQAGGGNSSVKINNGEMLIKASGCSLSEVKASFGYTTVITQKVSRIVNEKSVLEATSKKNREEIAAALVKMATIDQSRRPSIETLLHSFLLKYTLHTHPISINIILANPNWKSILNKVFYEDEIALVPYETPGIELAISLKNELNKFNEVPKIIFLQNHGLIVTSDQLDEIQELTEKCLEKVESYLNLDMSKYKMTTVLSGALQNVEKGDYITYLSEDRFLNSTLKKSKELFFLKPFCPDSFVFCGIGAVEIENIKDMKGVEAYLQRHLVFPKILIYKDSIYIISPSVKKARDIEDVLKFHIMILAVGGTDLNYLNKDELTYLSNWEAEKFRQNQ